MASTLNDREMDDLRDNFGLYDSVGDGKVESTNIGQVLRSVGLNPTQAEVDKVLNEIDPKGNKRISFEEFVPVMMSFRSRKHKYGQEVFIDSLRVFDTDNSGTISSGELRHVLTGLGEKLRDEDVDQLIQGFEDNQGQINYEEFVKSVMNGWEQIFIILYSYTANYRTRHEVFELFFFSRAIWGLMLLNLIRTLEINLW